MQLARKLRRLRPVHAEAALFIVTARLLTAVLPFKIWQRFVGAPQEGPAPAQTPPPLTAPGTATASPAVMQARSLAARVERVAPIVPLKATCLPRAIALLWMLRRRGYQSVRLHLGVASSPEAGFEAHAWLTVDGTIVIGETDSMFQPLLALEA